MSIHNADIAAAFEEIADLLSIQGANAFRIRAYRRAAQTVRGLPHQLAEADDPSVYEGLPGIGTDLAGKIAEFLHTGQLAALQRLRREVPAGLRELLALPGLGPARVRALRTALKITSRADLRRALGTGRLAKLRGFGPSLRAQLEQSVRHAPQATARRMPIAEAAQYAEPFRRFLQAVPGVERVEIVGSYRRGRDTIGDLDLLVSAPAGVAAIEALRGYAELGALSASGRTKASGVLRNGLRFDLRVVRAESFGAALQYFTGSKEHGIRLRQRAHARGLKLSEYGLFQGARRLVGRSEPEIYSTLGLAWIAPELREDRGEFEAAEHNGLPRLIERADLQGDLHVHTRATDGRDCLEDMVAAARAAGLSYVAITDHSKYLGIVHGLDAQRLARQCEAIDAFNERLRGFTVLKGAEVDILEDGSLALADAALAPLDVIVIAIHSHFELSQAKQTQRVLRALERPHVTILAHPTGRLLGEREPYALDFERVLAAAHARPCYLEVNGQPLRLDLDDVYVKAAVERGVPLALDSDAHASGQFANLDGAVRQARRGWACKQDVLNARPLGQLRPLLRATRG
jgi:DNA polymerase (family 10)